MAGHSKWANIKHIKASLDAKRGKIFTKIIREIVVASKNGGPNPEDNPTLRAVIDKALGANMKRDTIDKAIVRGAGTGDEDNYESIIYEGYGVSGVAVLVECLTDNRNRTVAEVRHTFSKRGGKLGTDGSVAYLFARTGQMSYGQGDENQIMEAALEAGAEDVVSNNDGSIDVLTAFEDYLMVKEAMVAAGLAPDHGEITMLPATFVELDEDGAEKILGMIDAFEDLDDVQSVYTNADISDDILMRFS